MCRSKNKISQPIHMGWEIFNPLIEIYGLLLTPYRMNQKI